MSSPSRDRKRNHDVDETSDAEHEPGLADVLLGGTRSAVVAGLLAVAATTATAADPFDVAGFESGWKQVARIAATGVASDGKSTAVAWGGHGFIVSRDAGLTWSNPVFPSTGPVGAPGSQPVEVADACCPSAGRVYVRTVDGAVRAGDGTPRNQMWGIGAVTVLAADGRGTMYAETQADVVAIRDDRVVIRAPGRLAGVVRDAAVTTDGVTVWRVDGATVRTLEVRGGVKADGLRGAVAMSSPAGSDTFRDVAGGSWTVRDGTLVSNGVPMGLEMRSFGGSNLSAGGMHFGSIGVAKDPGAKSGTALVGQDDGGGLRRIDGDVPSDLSGACQVTVPDGPRFRLLGVSPTRGVLMYRSSL